MKICSQILRVAIIIMEAKMMPVEKLSCETELASDTNDMSFFFSVVAILTRTYLQRYQRQFSARGTVCSDMVATMVGSKD